MHKNLTSNWHIMQDVHDSGEALELFKSEIVLTAVGHQLSEWEPIDRLEHLQVLLSDTPYWGRELRYFNQAPWWYLNEFTFSQKAGARTTLGFTNVDYFCKVWLNGTYLGEHEGYSIPFEFDVTDALRSSGPNQLLVKVWSPWDNKVHADMHNMRTFQVVRDLVKGTYEHDDTLVARDVNPVGIYGTVSLTSTTGPSFEGKPRISYELGDDLGSATVTVRGVLRNPSGSAADLQLRLVDDRSWLEVAAARFTTSPGAFEVTLDVSGIKPWFTWDHGDQPLYTLQMGLDGGETVERRLAFRRIGLERNNEQTTFFVNGQKLFVRGTSYFADVYMSTMTRERYLRDLHAVKAAGFNLIRVHVHVERDDFYSLCDELGIAVMQDSEYNWTHPIAQEWAERLTAIYEQTILMLDDHPSLIGWICLNEPGVVDPAGRTHGYAMEISPGPRLYAAVTALDPSRPAIKGSYCFDDMTSGDSHNYIGSLQGPDAPYTDIDGTKEKLNTEFGFDAPGSIANLRKAGKAMARLYQRADIVSEAQEYQYRLLKYYIEHYRAQKYRPCSGYVQFMFIDLSPQSFYGIYDWWGTPKRSLDALMESNQPVIGMIEQTAKGTDAVWLINDSLRDLGTVTVSWTVTGADGIAIAQGEQSVACGPDSAHRVAGLSIADDEQAGMVQAAVVVRGSDGEVIATNRYRDMFNHPAHVEGHPTRMTHEYGMRLYTA